MKTKTISNFGIIFAVALTMVTTVVFTACNSDDDFGGDLNGDITGQYSLATRMMTRAGENSGCPDDGLFIAAGDTTIYEIDLGGFKGELNVHWDQGFTGNRSPQSSVSSSIGLREYEKYNSTNTIRTKIYLQENITLWNDMGDGIVVRQKYEIETHNLILNKTEISRSEYNTEIVPIFTFLPEPIN